MRIRNESRRGSATIAALATVVAFVGVTGAFLAMSATTAQERNASGAEQRAFLAATSGLADTLARMNTEDADPALGALAKTEFGSSEYWTTLVDNGDDTWTITSTGAAGNARSNLRAVVLAQSGGVFSNAVFAGNEDGDPNYVMEFGGSAGQADDIRGDVFSGGDIQVSDDATISGTPRASGFVYGAAGEDQQKQGIPDLKGMNYEANADFDVAALFAAEETNKWDNAGGYAFQVPEDNPAHIFRKNPSDRKSEINSTAKDDYFLEDPYEKVNSDSAQDGGSDVYKFSLTGVDGESGPDSNGKVFFIDGNLWLHNKKSYSIGLNHNESDGVQITFVVKGNIYFSDNFFYSDEDDDGVVFIAMEDENVPDSGNIFLGDPEFGTLKRMNAFMYAENDFYDYNLDASGSAKVEIYGNMSAGNQVLIERDYQGSHTKLTVDFDERLPDGSLELPMLPTGSGTEPGAFVVQAWWPCESEVTEDVAGHVTDNGVYAGGVEVD